MTIRSLISGLSLLRYPELVEDLGERRFHLLRVVEIRKRFPGVKFHRNVVLSEYRPELLTLGRGATVCEGTVLAFGDVSGRIQIGSKTWVGEYNNLRAGGGDIVIGDGCLVSQFCTLVASNHGTDRDLPVQQQSQESRKRGVILGNDVWLGAGVSILPGIRVGEGAIIGAGSVVTRDVPPYEIWAGIPVERIGHRV